MIEFHIYYQMNENLSLTVEESPVQSGGRARISSETLKKMGLGEGELAVLSSDRKDILVTIFSDNLIGDGKIKVRQQDLKKLGIKKGDMVKIKEHQNLLTKLL
mgnify:CR=1 FL=1